MPETASDPIDGFETIAIVYSMSEAAMLLATLSSHGFLVAPQSRGHISALPNWMLALDGIRITILSAQMAGAIAFLEEADAGWRCPPPPLPRLGWFRWPILVLVTLLFTAAPMPRAAGVYRWRSATAAATG